MNLAKGCQELRKLNVSGCSGLEVQWMGTIGTNLPNLRELCLNECKSLTDQGLAELLGGLSIGASKSYQRWRMKNKLVSSVQTSSLGGLLTNQSAHYDIDLEDGLNKDEGESEKESDADDTEDGEDAVPGNTASQSHSLHGNQEGPKARLIYLGLSQCHLLTQEALRAVSQHCSHHLRRLELSGCKNLDDDGLVHLAHHCTSLKRLDLEEIIALTDASLRAFATNLPRLERICLSFCENVTDQGIMRMLRPAPNPTTLSTATVMMINSGAASRYCPKLAHIELDNCMLITDRLLLDFANVLEERKAVAAERMKERERKREERRKKLEQKRRQVSPRQRKGWERVQEQGQEHEQQCEEKSEEEQGPGPFRTLIRGKRQRDQDAGVGSSSMASTAGNDVFAYSVPVNIPSRLRHKPSLTCSSIPSYSSSPLQPRSVLASTSLSEEIVIKKTRPGMRTMAPTRSTSTSSTSSSSSLSLWSPNSAWHKKSLTRIQPKMKIIKPTIQVLDCRNITLEGVEAAQNRCPTLKIRSYYSWANPSSSAPTVSALGSAIEGLDGEEGVDTDDDDPDASGHTLNSSQTSLHYVQMQQELLQQQIRYRSRTMNLLFRARRGLVGPAGGHRDAQCLIL